MLYAFQIYIRSLVNTLNYFAAAENKIGIKNTLPFRRLRLFFYDPIP